MSDPDFQAPPPPAPGDPAPPADPPEDPPVVDIDDAFDKDRAMNTIRNLREKEREGKRVAKELADIQARLKEYEDREKSEVDRAKDAEKEARDRVKNATEKLRNANLKAALYDKAQELGIGSASLALKALDRKKIEWDDEDEPANLATVLEALLEEEPVLKASPKKRTASTDAGGGSGNGERPALTQEELEWAAKTGMTPDEYAASKSIENVNDWNSSRARSAA